MKAKCLLILPEKKTLPQCEAIRKTTYYDDNSNTNKQCVQHSRYLIEGKHYCKTHGALVALEILLKESE